MWKVVNSVGIFILMDFCYDGNEFNCLVIKFKENLFLVFFVFLCGVIIVLSNFMKDNLLMKYILWNLFLYIVGVVDCLKVIFSEISLVVVLLKW